MAKKKETNVEDVTKATSKTTTKTTAKSTVKKTTAKKTTAKAKSGAKVTKITEEKIDKEAPAATEGIQDSEKEMALRCHQMMSSIMEWTLDSFLYSNIVLISKKMSISMEEAAAVLDVDPADLKRLSLVYAAYSGIAEPEKANILGKYVDRIKVLEPEKKTKKGKKTSTEK
ncbi:MAG: hypothetical protein IKP88_15270 [Lachnospiraceae bacterium]|nr:hypothetical protein [Lachnospiraceae bacterium]